MMWVNIYGDNTDFIALGVIVIAYINSVSLLLFSTFGSHVWMASCLDPSIYWRCFGIWHPSDQFYHMISMWSPQQARRLCQMHGI